MTLVVATIGSIAAGAAPGAATTKTGAAGPTEDGPVCAVLPTADGFAALRERPAVSARLIARMKTEANVIVQERPKHHIVRQGGWIQVRYWPDGELPAPGEPGLRQGRDRLGRPAPHRGMRLRGAPAALRRSGAGSGVARLRRPLRRCGAPASAQALRRSRKAFIRSRALRMFSVELA